MAASHHHTSQGPLPPTRLSSSPLLHSPPLPLPLPPPNSERAGGYQEDATQPRSLGTSVPPRLQTGSGNRLLPHIVLHRPTPSVATYHTCSYRLTLCAVHNLRGMGQGQEYNEMVRQQLLSQFPAGGGAAAPQATSASAAVPGGGRGTGGGTGGASRQKYGKGWVGDFGHLKAEPRCGDWRLDSGSDTTLFSRCNVTMFPCGVAPIVR